MNSGDFFLAKFKFGVNVLWRLLPAQDRRNLLKQWVQRGENASSIEASICLSKTDGTTLTHDKELLTVDEMNKRGIAPQKIQAVVSRGGGVPDPDVPQDQSLMKFWISTSTRRVEKQEVSMETKMPMQAQADAASVDGFFNTEGSMGAAGSGRWASASMDDILGAISSGQSRSTSFMAGG